MAKTMVNIPEGIPACTTVTWKFTPERPRRDAKTMAISGEITSLITDTNEAAAKYSLTSLNSRDKPSDNMIRGMAAPLK